MLKNEESQATTITGQTESVHDVDSYVEPLQRCKVSKNTAGLLSCILLLYDLYDKVFVELEEINNLLISEKTENQTNGDDNKISQMQGEGNAASVYGNSSTGKNYNSGNAGNDINQNISNCNSTEIILFYNELLRKKDEVIEKLLTAKFM